MKQYFGGLSLLLLSFCGKTSDRTSQTSDAQALFPNHPDETITPGALCNKQDVKRYPEQIPYCERSVTSEIKDQIINTYDLSLGFKIKSMNRVDFKIDHYIPLCMGGANNETNLWPQHKTIYVQTDKIEELLCEKMKIGKMKQVEAVTKIKRVKFHLDEALNLLKTLQN